MIASLGQYENAMREMIRNVQSGYEPPLEASVEDLELLADCIRKGYLIGRTTDENGRELRTMDGKMHPELINHVVTPKGLAFLEAAGTPNQNLSISDMAQELKKLRQEVANYRAQEQQRSEAEAVEASKKQKRDFKQNVFIAAFSVVLTLFFEHLGDIFRFFVKLFSSLH